MKRHLSTLFTIIMTIGILSSCEDKRFQTYTANVPVYLSYEDLRKAIEIETPKEISQPGKIYFKDSIIFINEFMEGVHVINISDPANPIPLSYIPVPGNIDMAIKDSILYLDSYTDLVLIDISDPVNPFEKSRIENILEYTLPEYDYNYPLAEIDEDMGVVTGFEIKEYTQEIHFNTYPYPMYERYVDYDMLNSVKMSSGGAGSASTYGVGGSMARFLTYDKYLYMLQTTNMLKIADISKADTPAIEYEKYVGWGLETMFIYQDFLYLGSTEGMYILDLQDPKNPFTTSVYSHIRSCDPVAVNNNLAYVTLRTGGRCGGAANLLEVINISDKYNPKRVASYPITEPYGLGISGNTLFVCLGNNGLVVYDATDPIQITDNKLAEFADIKSTDVIPVNDMLFTIGDGGFYIYDYSDLNDITQLGSISVSSN